MSTEASHNILPDGTPDSPPISTDPTPAVPWGWLRAVLFVLAYIVLTLVMAVVTVVVFGAASQDDVIGLMSTPKGVIIQLISFLATLLVVWAFRRGLDRRSLVSLGFTFDKSARRDLAAGMLWGAGLIGFIFVVLLVTGQIALSELAFPVEAFLIQVALGVLVAASEETMLRGYLLNNFMKSANKYLALLLVSVLFSLFHGFNPGLSMIGLVNIVLAGLLLGIYYVHRKNLWFPIGLHFTWNLFQGAVFGAPVSGLKFDSIISFDPKGSEMLTGGEFGFEASIITTVVMILAAATIHWKYRPDGRVPVAGDSDAASAG